MRRISLLLAILLAGCGTNRTKIETVEVKVPIRVTCIETRPKAPEYWFGRGEYPGTTTALGVLVEDLEAAKQYGAQWEAAAAGCEADAPLPSVN